MKEDQIGIRDAELLQKETNIRWSVFWLLPAGGMAILPIIFAHFNLKDYQFRPNLISLKPI
jgi:hypothetical protein